jgi:hypothetical protein
LPCEHLQTLDPAWRGLTIGLLQTVADLGEEAYSEAVLRTIGEYAEYGDLRFKSAAEIRALLLGDNPGSASS